jgi:hypothetical protein
MAQALGELRNLPLKLIVPDTNAPGTRIQREGRFDRVRDK